MLLPPLFLCNILQCGRVAGRNAAGRSQKLETVPYFWTMQWGDKINYVGNASSCVSRLSLAAFL